MERCETCLNAYERTFKIYYQGKEHTFDCFECAIHKLAPRCKNCDIRIIGHGVESAFDIYCCAGCARVMGITDLKDHSDQRPTL